mmetsp:Transcript_25721/g.64854  ORF Transcript_25721/g.64854 Transcript_25721/m.64854 type:complete len:257 (+) Transcript_25721:407-1177(+)
MMEVAELGDGLNGRHGLGSTFDEQHVFNLDNRAHEHCHDHSDQELHGLDPGHLDVQHLRICFHEELGVDAGKALAHDLQADEHEALGRGRCVGHVESDHTDDDRENAHPHGPRQPDFEHDAPRQRKHDDAGLRVQGVGVSTHLLHREEAEDCLDAEAGARWCEAEGLLGVDAVLEGPAEVFREKKDTHNLAEILRDEQALLRVEKARFFVAFILLVERAPVCDANIDAVARAVQLQVCIPDRRLSIVLFVKLLKDR